MKGKSRKKPKKETDWKSILIQLITTVSASIIAEQINKMLRD